MDNLSIRQLNYLTEKYEFDSKLQADKEVTMAVVKRKPSLIQFANKELQNDEEVAVVCVKSDGRALRFMSEQLRENERVVLSAVENFCASFAFAVGGARRSQVIAEAVAKRGGETIELLDEEFLDSEKIAKIAIERNPKALKYFSSRIRAIESIVKEVGGNIYAKAFVFAEGDAAKRDDVIFVDALPLL